MSHAVSAGSRKVTVAFNFTSERTEYGMLNIIDLLTNNMIAHVCLRFITVKQRDVAIKCVSVFGIL